MNRDPSRFRWSVLLERQRDRAIPTDSWTPQESQVERCEHQDDSNIHCQPFPESVSQEHEIYTDYDGCHRHHVKHDSYLSAYFQSWFNRKFSKYPLANPLHAVVVRSAPVPRVCGELLIFPGIRNSPHTRFYSVSQAGTLSRS